MSEFYQGIIFGAILSPLILFLYSYLANKYEDYLEDKEERHGDR